MAIFYGMLILNLCKLTAIGSNQRYKPIMYHLFVFYRRSTILFSILQQGNSRLAAANKLRPDAQPITIAIAMRHGKCQLSVPDMIGGLTQRHKVELYPKLPPSTGH